MDAKTAERSSHSLGPVVAEGKTKTIHRIAGSDDLVGLVSKDDITAGDGAKHDVIAGKGALANRTTCNVFRLLKACGLPVAFEQQDSATSFVGPHCTMLPYEVVTRREAHGSYLKRHPGFAKGQLFPKLIVEFYLKTKGKTWKGKPLVADDPLMIYTDGGALDTVVEKYRRVADITGHFGVPQQRIILWRGSETDKTEAFAQALGDLAELMSVVTCSVHKEPVAAAHTLHRMVQDVPDSVMIAYIGRSNGAGPTLSAMSTIPVITVPASAREFPEDVWSSLRAPSKVPVMTVLEPANAVLAALQILSGRNPRIYARVRGEIEERTVNTVVI